MWELWVGVGRGGVRVEVVVVAVVVLTLVGAMCELVVGAGSAACWMTCISVFKNHTLRSLTLFNILPSVNTGTTRILAGASGVAKFLVGGESGLEATAEWRGWSAGWKAG